MPLARLRRVGHTRPDRAPDHSAGDWGRLRPPPFVRYAAMLAHTEEVEQGLSLRQWGVPCDALASVFGRDALFWYRAWLAFGRPSLLGTTVKDPQNVPTDLVADAKVTWVAGQEVDVPTTVGGGCFLGVRVVATVDTAALETGYGACAREAHALVPDSHPRSVCPDGWHATREAWRRLFPKIALVLCFLHGEMNMAVASVGLAVGKSLDPLHQSIAEAIRETLGESLKTHVDGLAATLIQIRREAAATAELLEKIHSGREGILIATGEMVARANILTERGKELDHVAQQVGALLSALDRLSISVHQLTQSGVIAHPEPDFLTALRRVIEASRVSNVSQLAVSLAQVQSSVSRVEEGVSRLNVLAEGPKRARANSFFRKTWARLRRSARGRSV